MYRLYSLTHTYASANSYTHTHTHKIHESHNQPMVELADTLGPVSMATKQLNLPLCACTVGWRDEGEDV